MRNQRRIRPYGQRTRTVALVLGVLLGSATNAVAAPTPLIVAVDTSRSLQPDQLSATVEDLTAALRSLPRDTPTGLLAFDDEARWIAPLGATPEAVAGALAGLTPRGDHTLLNDGLFVAVRELTSGGVILLATDGRDEQSATTVEDIARRCEDQNVRIVSLGSGGRVNALFLRRLAMLTDGRFLGTATDVGAAALGAAIGEARAAVADAQLPPATAPSRVASSREAAPTSPAAAEPAAASGSEAPIPPASTRGGRRGIRWLGPLAILGALAAIVVAVLLHRRRGGAVQYCPRCGSEMDGDTPCATCDQDERRQALIAEPSVRATDVREMTDNTVVLPSPDTGAVDQTRVLATQPLLEVRERGGHPRLFQLDRERSFTVGRAEGDNSLTLGDPALSAQHFKLVPENGSFTMIDLGSTNGSFVNGQRRDVAPLRPGDVIAAGQAEFEVRTELDLTR